MKTRVTVETLTEELNEAAAVAREAKQPGAMVQAISTKAKLHGLLIDRKESGAPGDFSSADSTEQVLEIVRKEHGDKLADMLASALGKSDEVQDLEQPGSEPATTLDGNDTVN